jgi:hypothetical protein
MKTDKRKMLTVLQFCGVLIVAGIVLATILYAVGAFDFLTNKPVAQPFRGKPEVLAKHIAQLREAIPGNGGEGGPGSPEEEGFLQRAYPDADIPLARFETARAAAAAIQGRDFPTGKGRPGTFVTIGPSNAMYPFTQFRTSATYVPNAYAAGGRTVALAIAPNCKPGDCRLWVAPAGGGIWRTKNALTGEPSWQYLSGPFGINAIGSIAMDPNDASGNTLWVGTGEANACGSGCIAGVGLYKTTNGGDTWTGPYGKTSFDARGIGSVVVKPGDSNTIYAASTRSGRGISSVATGGVVTLVPGAPAWGLYKSTDGGNTWTFLHNGAPLAASCDTVAEATAGGSPCSIRGVRQVVLDPADANTVYASSYQRGVWRSNDGGATWTQIKPSLDANVNTMRPMLAVNLLSNGNTRMYVAEGGSGNPYSRLFRSDNVRAGAPVFTDLTSNNPANLGYGSYNFCTGQCWYDNFVVSPAGHPDIVYLGGSYQYGETGGLSNGRGVLLSTDAGVSFTDMTMDATDPVHPNGIHPDQHFLVVNPTNPYQFFEGSDGGIMRSSGQFANVSAWCDARTFTGANAADKLNRCKQLLSRVPTKLESMNKGLTTLQFMSLSISPFNANIVQGGTQDNGTWQTDGNPTKWLNTMIGDGGQSGFDAVNPAFRFHTFYDASPDVNFSNGDMADWNWISDPIFGTGGQFYVPIISDPKVSKTMFVGAANVWRTKTWGMGAMSLTEFRQHCNEWYGDFAVVCGDWVQIASPSLNSSARGDRSGGAIAAVERTKSDSSTAWVATTTGRVFISKNVDADPASAVTWTRLDSTAANDPNRFVSGIYIDPANANHAWISYSGFNATTPATPGHVFEVTYNPGAGTATWVDRSYDLGDIPITDVVRDDVTGDLYASSDFGVFRLVAGSTTWTVAAPGMPNVEVTGMTIAPNARKLYVATHGLGAWLLNLP